MDLFKPGRKPCHPAPLLWRRHDIFASDDVTAQVLAEDLYRTHSSQLTLVNFRLWDGGGHTVYELAQRNDPYAFI